MVPLSRSKLSHNQDNQLHTLFSSQFLYTHTEYPPCSTICNLGLHSLKGLRIQGRLSALQLGRRQEVVLRMALRLRLQGNQGMYHMAQSGRPWE